MDAAALEGQVAERGGWRLPASWLWTPLGNLGTWTGGGTPSKANPTFWENGTVPWVSPKDMKVGVIGETQDKITVAAVAASSAKYVSEGSVLMVMRSGILKHSFPVAVTDRIVTLNQDLRALTPHAAIDARFIAHYLALAANQVLHDCSKDGTTVDSIEFSALEKLPIPLAPLAEQRRIVARVDELFAEIADGEAALAEMRKGLDIFRRALLKAAVTGELTKDWRVANAITETGHDWLTRVVEYRASTAERRGHRHAAVPHQDTSVLPALPEGWTWTRMGELMADSLIGIDRGATNQRSAPPGSPYIKMQNVSTVGTIDLTKLVYVDASVPEIARFTVNEGDILFNTRNSKELVGKAALVTEIAPGTIFNNNLMRVRTMSRPLNKWLANVMISPPFRQAMEKIKKATTNVAAIYAKDLIGLPVPIPPPAEATEILRKVSDALAASADTLAQLGAEAADSARLKQSILKAAFEGRLVPQDPADEPASALLARVGASSGAPRGRRMREKSGGLKLQ